ncbi:MAG: hypothetical protein A2202_02765 [Bdellovibrionales bacterium RIFOXYA1_FULL_36_14]|nr:MAG: hypothetical protein A2202_02765 [Bdellovibrionales bacterium RIFOXYA1_FULL_36_14]
MKHEFLTNKIRYRQNSIKESLVKQYVIGMSLSLRSGSRCGKIFFLRFANYLLEKRGALNE